jgi:ethanolamine transporter EutH
MMTRIQMLIAKIGTVIILVIGAISPVFRNDRDAAVAASISIALLGAYAMIQVIRTHSWEAKGASGSPDHR